MEPGGAELMAGQVSCPGEWVLMEAMCRTEAGELFALAGAKPEETRVREHLWKITTAQAEEAAEGEFVPEAIQKPTLPEETVQRLARHLEHEYPHPEATVTPSKQTATQLKGRQKDNEAAEQAKPVAFQRTWRKLSADPKNGKEYGNVMHGLMQYIRFASCTSAEGLESEIQRLVAAELLTTEQAALIDRQGVTAFFETETGQKMITGEVLREFKFSILDDAEKYGEGLRGEKILLQGVVDCALIESDGITIVDFKTDRVTDKTLETVKNRYREQIRIYAEALARIYEMPVKKRYLYLFHLRELVEI